MKDEQATVNVLGRGLIGTHHGVSENDATIKTLGEGRSIVIDGGVFADQKFSALRGYVREEGNPEFILDSEDPGDLPIETARVYHVIAPKLGISPVDKALQKKMATMEEHLRCTRWARNHHENDSPLTLFVMLGGYDIAAQRVQNAKEYVDHMVATLSYWGQVSGAARVIWMGTGYRRREGSCPPVVRAIHHMIDKPCWAPATKGLGFDVEKYFRKHDYASNGQWTDEIMGHVLSHLVDWWTISLPFPSIILRFGDLPPEFFLHREARGSEANDHSGGTSDEPPTAQGSQAVVPSTVVDFDEAGPSGVAPKRIRLADIHLPGENPN